MVTGALVGVEALVRWRHPHEGIVDAARFIEQIEQNGLVDALVRAVLPAALREIAAGESIGPALRPSVNLSIDNLRALDFPDFVANAAAEARFPLSRLVMEVAERRLAHGPLSSLYILTRLGLKRISLSADDFGMGHASSAQLRDCQYDEIKIDRSFVHGAWADDSLDAIVRASLMLAGHLNMATVAEGGEDADDLHHIRALQCERAHTH
ncbi:EAL domain-containing protein [Burkholderia sp. Tr-862]|uniref:EAL domain-containing protein n=1 Tax=Burkholderia sp. Tr-862 TaxID=2608331 RepID=UPI001419C2F8